MSNPLFGPEVREMDMESDTVGMKTFCETLHPATVAETLAEELEVPQVWKFLRQTDIKNQAIIFEYFPIDWQVQMVDGTGRELMAHLIEEMSHDDRADLMRRLRPVVRDQVLRLVDDADRHDIAALTQYPEDSAGALMTTDYAWLPEHISVGEALDRLRLQAPDRETIYYVYVLNDERRLLGMVSLRSLILSPRHAILRDIMERDVVTIPATATRDEVAQMVQRYDFLALPVINADNRLVGIITHDDVIDLVVQQATEDAQRAAGMEVIEENYLEANPLVIWRKRVVWLACLFVAGMFTLLAMAHFQSAIERVAVLSLFIPLCISTGGNSGAQAATLTTRALGQGHITAGDWLRVLRHELLLGVLLGLSLGAIGYLRVLLWPPSQMDGLEGWRLANVIACSVFGICLWGTVVGAMLPLGLKHIGVDPAFAASPFIATLVDVTGIVIYFSIAGVWIPALANGG